MECIACGKTLHLDEVVRDYMGDDWCKDCMYKEVNRRANEIFIKDKGANDTSKNKR